MMGAILQVTISVTALFRINVFNLMLIVTGHCKARGVLKWNPEYTSQVLISLYTAAFNS